jgi:hypothetical protein
LVLFAENAVTVSCEKLVKIIANRLRNDYESVQPRPRRTEAADDAQRGSGVRIRPVILNKNYRIDRYQIAARVGVAGDLRRKPELIREASSFLRLKRGEFEIALVIVFDYKIHGAVAKIAYSVEQNYRSHKKILPQFSDRY